MARWLWFLRCWRWWLALVAGRVPPVAFTGGGGAGHRAANVLPAGSSGSLAPHHAEHAERRDIGDATLEQLHADVARLSRAYMNGQPLALFSRCAASAAGFTLLSTGSCGPVTRPTSISCSAASTA